MTRRRLEWILIAIMRVMGYLFFTTAVAFPFYWLILSSVQSMTRLMTLPPTFWIPPWEWNFSTYSTVLFEHGFLRYIGNSLLVSTITVLLTIILSTMAAYAATRLRFTGRQLMGRTILLVYMFPAIVLVIPLFVLFSWLRLRDTLIGLIVIYLSQTLPVALYLLKSYFETLSVEFEEAAMVDGLSRLEVIWRVTVPLSLPTMASVALYTFIITWNEFLFAFILLDTPSKFTLPIGIIHLAESLHTGQQLLAAAAVIATVPIIVMFLYFERFLVRGLTAGGLKG